MKQAILKKIIIFTSLLLAVNFFFIFSPPASGAMPDANDFWGGQTAKQYVQENSGLPAEPNTDLRMVVVNIIKFVLGFLGILAVIIVLYAGFKWMLSGGSEEKIGDAKKMLIAGLIGLVIIIFAYIIVNFVITQIVEIVKD